MTSLSTQSMFSTLYTGRHQLALIPIFPYSPPSDIGLIPISTENNLLGEVITLLLLFRVQYYSATIRTILRFARPCARADRSVSVQPVTPFASTVFQASSDTLTNSAQGGILSLRYIYTCTAHNSHAKSGTRFGQKFNHSSPLT